MFNYFIKGIQKSKTTKDISHLSKQFLKRIDLFNPYELALCLNKFSKTNFQDKQFWNNVCFMITRNNKKKKVDNSIYFKKKVELKKEKQNEKKNFAQENEEERDKKDKEEEQEKEKNTLIIKIQENDSTNSKDLEKCIEEKEEERCRIIDNFNIEELCLTLNALAKVNVFNTQLMKLATEKLLKEFDVNKHFINTVKAISYFNQKYQQKEKEKENDNDNDKVHVLFQTILKYYEKNSTSLTERDISTILELSINYVPKKKREDEQKEKQEINEVEEYKEKKEKEENKSHKITDEVSCKDLSIEKEEPFNDLKCVNLQTLELKLLNNLSKVSYISEQSIALILNAYNKSLTTKNKKLLEVLKLIIILKIKKEKNCSDIFISSVTHSYASFNYKDKILFNSLANYTLQNMKNFSTKSLIIILNSFVNINIINRNLFNEVLNRITDTPHVIENLSNQCTANVITIFTKSYNFLNKDKIAFLFQKIIKRIKREYALALKRKQLPIIQPEQKQQQQQQQQQKQKQKQKHKQKHYYTENDEKNNKQTKTPFVCNFLVKQITNILNNLSKLNFANHHFFQICTHLILLKQTDINKLDLLNITSAYARQGFRNQEIFKILKIYTKTLLKKEDLKFAEFINLFNSISTFCLMEEKIWEIEENKNKQGRDINTETYIHMDTESDIKKERERDKKRDKEIKKKQQNEMKNKEAMTETVTEKKELWTDKCEKETSSTIKFKHLMELMIKRLKEKPTRKGEHCILNTTCSSKWDNNEREEKREKKEKEKEKGKEQTENCSIYHPKEAENYDYTSIKNKTILENLSVSHICIILSSLAKLNIHDEIIYRKSVHNIKQKIHKLDGKCFAMYLLYISKFNITPEKHIYETICACFNYTHKVKTKKNKESIIPNDKRKKETKLSDNQKKLQERMNHTDIINSIYIIRCLIKTGMVQYHLKGNSKTTLIQQCLKNVYVRFKEEQVKNKTKHNTSLLPNIIKVENEEYNDTSLLKKREFNIRSCCILINSISYLMTHIYIKNKTFAFLNKHLLTYSFQYLFKKLKVSHQEYTMYTINRIHTNEADTTEKLTKRIKEKIDSASLRQIKMSIFILFHLGWESTNDIILHPHSKESDTYENKRKRNIYNIDYPLGLLRQFYFFLIFISPFNNFEKYSTVSYPNLSTYKKICPLSFTQVVEDTGNKIQHKQMPNISNIEIAIYQTLLNILTKKKKKEKKTFNILANQNVFIYSVDLVLIASPLLGCNQ